MKRSDKLNPVMKLSAQKAREGLKAIAYVQDQLAHEQARLAQLLQAKSEYSKNDNLHKVNSYTLSITRNFQQQVSTAIGQQMKQIAVIQSQLEEVRKRWQQLDARKQSLEKTQLKLQQQELTLQLRREQLEMEQNHNLRNHKAQ